MRQGNEGRCYGKWDIKDPACAKCLECARVKCEETTKRLAAAAAGDEPDGSADGGGMEGFSANEHFLRLLEGNLERRVNWGDPVVTNIYYGTDSEPGGEPAVFAAYHRLSGRMKVRSAKVRRMVLLKSVDEAEALAKEILG
jgi:hypothetical protein